MRRRARPLAATVLCASLALVACSGGKATTGTGGSSGTGAAAGNGGNAGGAGAVDTGGTSGALGTAGSGAAGTIATGGSSGTTDGGAGAGGSPAPDAATTTEAGTEASGGQNCAGNALSLSANATGTADDTARARVVLDLMTDLPIGNANRTIEFWAYIKPTDWVGEKNELYVYGDLNTKAGAFGMDFGTFEVKDMAGNHATLNPITGGGFNDDSTNYLGITSTTTQWVHVAMTWDGTVVRTYANGALKITSPGTGGVTMLATVSSMFTLGCNPYSCFNGYFDDLRIWNTTRSDAEIMDNYDKTLAGDEAGLVGYWKFDEAPGATTAADSVTTAGHTAHAGMLMSANAAGRPTFITPNPPAPILCR